MNNSLIKYLAGLTVGYILLALASWCDDTWAAPRPQDPLADQYVQAVYDSIDAQAPAGIDLHVLDMALEHALDQDYEARRPRQEACKYLSPRTNCLEAYEEFWRTYEAMTEI